MLHPAEDQISVLLRQYKSLQAQGQHVSPEQLCRDHPELLEEVRQRIEGRAPGLMDQASASEIETQPPRSADDREPSTLPPAPALPQADPWATVSPGRGSGDALDSIVVSSLVANWLR